MSRIKNLFNQKNKNILNIYCTAGFPKLDNTIVIMQKLQEAGADIIELGMPYSDPLADGETIQLSSKQALENGMSIEVLFQQLEHCRGTIQIPIILMGYLNPILQYGFDSFCAKAKQIGVDGFIIPDLPIIDFEKEYQQIFKKYDLDFTFLITPNTSVERIKKLDSLSSGFLYAVSSSSTTGSSKDFGEVATYLQHLQSLQLTNPVLVGFGIHDKSSFNKVSQYANGGIIGSAFIKALQNSKDVAKTTIDFVHSIK
jgi:tryptophan synthase alpha chain